MRTWTGVTALLLLAGCAGNGALEAIGLARPRTELADAQKPPRTIAIRMHASKTLNTDAAGRPLALVAKIYKLRQRSAFEQAPYAAFLDPRREHEVFGADLIEVKEVVLVPGQRYEVLEKVTREAGYVGVVALFNSPAPGRWRIAFSAPAAEQSGLVIGAHGCALSVGVGVGAAQAAAGASPVHCH